MHFWSTERRGKSAEEASKEQANKKDPRIPQQHDYDRLLFSPPVRRLANKTQVFPLEKNDTVRTRLTHSHEVANLARSMGDRILKDPSKWKDRAAEVRPMLQAIGLGHDLGNPPFGHEGEKAIGAWFEVHKEKFDGGECGAVPEQLWPEFVEFEGNAQTLRVVARLQVSVGGFGLDLTAGTLAALMKYPTTCDLRDSGSQATKKYGYFECESDAVRWIRECTGLGPGERHPLTWIMEAADDIAYSSLDIEDAIKKRILSPEDVLAEIQDQDGEAFGESAEELKSKFEFDRSGRSVEEVREIKASYFRTVAINHMIDHAVAAFIDDFSNINEGKRTRELLEGCGLCALLKEIAYSYAFDSRGVRRVEADGSVAIAELMTFLWNAIDQRKDPKKLDSKRLTASAAYGWTLFSDNYKQNAIRNHYRDRDGTDLPMRYKELRLLTDMISGMTDGYLMDLHRSLKAAGHV